MQTENGEKIFNYYKTADVLEFASDWYEFFAYQGCGNEFSQWWSWCDEFAKYILEAREDEAGTYGLIVSAEDEEDLRVCVCGKTYNPANGTPWIVRDNVNGWGWKCDHHA